MQKQVLNYRIIIEPEKMGKKVVYNAYCPTLGVADYGDSIDEDQEVPVDNVKQQVVVNTEVSVPQDTKIFAV